MQASIHPNYFPSATITCACGAKYEAGSTMEHIDIELCASCHPFFTGKQKIVDTARRVEKFTDRAAQKSNTMTAKDKAAKKAARASAKAAKKADRDTSIKSVNA